MIGTLETCANKICYNLFGIVVRPGKRQMYCSSTCRQYQNRRGQDPEYYKSYYAKNRDKVIAVQRAYYSQNKAKVIRQQQSRRYNVDVEALLTKQDSQCGICKEPFGGSSPYVDHDHACCPGAYSCGKCVRGLLCDPCNRGIGAFKDNPASLLEAAKYLSLGGA